MVEAAVGFVSVKHAKCTVLPVHPVAMRRKCLFSRAMIAPSIVVNVTNHNVPVTPMTGDRVGNAHDRDFNNTW
jgi:hypothetical protein